MVDGLQNNIKIIFLHAKEIIQRLGDGTLDYGISGLDLLKESEKNIRDTIILEKKNEFWLSRSSCCCPK